MLMRGVAKRVVGGFQDVRPALTQYDSQDGAVLANFDAGGLFKVVQINRFGERREFSNLKKIEAAMMVSNQRKRGYRAYYQPMALI